MDKYIKAGVIKDFPDVRTTGITLDGLEICVARAGDIFYAFDNSCTHAEAALADSEIEEGMITCPLHGAKFDVSTGVPKSLPATQPLKMYDVKIEGQDVLIRLNPES